MAFPDLGDTNVSSRCVGVQGPPPLRASISPSEIRMVLTGAFFFFFKGRSGVRTDWGVQSWAGLADGSASCWRLDGQAEGLGSALKALGSPGGL